MEGAAMGLALVVHGGAGTIPAARYEAARDGCRAAATAGWKILRAGGSALDAIVAAITVLEDNPGFNAGTGAVLTSDGRAELDAGIMDGETLDVGAVANVQRIHNPVQLARAVLTSPYVVLASTGAELFATENGIALCDPEALITPAQRAHWQRGFQAVDDVDTGEATDHNALPSEVASIPAHTGLIHSDGTRHGTVGAVAVDAGGHIAAGASTGGIAAKHPGRVGDTPLVGSGFYAEDGIAGVSSTGHGEDFIRLLLAKRAADCVAGGASAQAAATAAIRLLGSRVGGIGGLILLDHEGRLGCARNTASMAYAFISEGMRAPVAGV